MRGMDLKVNPEKSRWCEQLLECGCVIGLVWLIDLQHGDNRMVTTIKEGLKVIRDWKFQALMGGWRDGRMGRQRRAFFFSVPFVTLFKLQCDGTKDVNTESLWLLGSWRLRPIFYFLPMLFNRFRCEHVQNIENILLKINEMSMFTALCKWKWTLTKVGNCVFKEDHKWSSVNDCMRAQLERKAGKRDLKCKCNKPRVGL